MNAGIEAGRSLALGGMGFIGAATGWGLVLACKAPVWDAGPFRRQPGFQPAPRPPSSGAAIFAALAALVLWIAAFVLLPRLGALGMAPEVLVPRSATRAAGVAWALFAGGEGVLLAFGLVLAEVGVWLRGQAVLRYPNPRTGVLLGAGLGLVAGAVAAALTCLVLAVPALRHGHTSRGSFSVLAVWALALGVATLPPSVDAARRSLPALGFMARNEALSRPTLR